MAQYEELSIDKGTDITLQLEFETSLRMICEAVHAQDVPAFT